MTPYTPLHPYDVTILFLDYDVIIFDDVSPAPLRPWRRTPTFLLLKKWWLIVDSSHPQRINDGIDGDHQISSLDPTFSGNSTNIVCISDCYI